MGCQHDAGITAAEYFCVNPDRRRRVYNTPIGMYSRCAGFPRWRFSYLSKHPMLVQLQHETILAAQDMKFGVLVTRRHSLRPRRNCNVVHDSHLFLFFYKSGKS